MNANTDISNILAVAKAYAGHFNHSLNTVSLRAASQGRFLADLEAGKRGITLTRRDAIMQWFSDNWPGDVKWPARVLRPTPNQKDAA